MSDMNIKTYICNKNNEDVAVNTSEHTEVISENVWIIGVSKTHPGLKYYFNTITGVSLWNIRREDMERAKQTMNSHQNQSLYINCPEPKDPPPNKRTTDKLAQSCCKHISQQSKHHYKQCLKSGLATDTSGISCDVCFDTVNSLPNLITVNFRSCPQPACNSQIDNACSPHSPIQPTSTFLDSSELEKINCSKGLHNFVGSKRPRNRSIAETAVQDPSNDRLHNQSNIDSEFCYRNTSHFETLDLAPLKMFAKSDVINDKWYIIADADVYLHHIKLLKSVVSSDNQCCLMVPQNVRIGLENATKTELRTKAYCASYFIYKMFDLGHALVDEDSSKCIQDKSNEEHILQSCSKLKEQHFYVVVISNDIDLQKYRNKIYIPIFTVAEIKEYLYKTNYSETAKSPEPTFNRHESIITNPDQWNKKSKEKHDIGTQVDGLCDAPKTTDAEVQTNCHPIQLENDKNAYDSTDFSNQNENINRRRKFSTSNCQLSESSLHNCISGSSKRIKLRRQKLCHETAPNLSTKAVDQSENPVGISNTLSNYLSNNNLLLDKNIEEKSKNTIKDLKSNETTTSQSLKQIIEENLPIPKKPLKSNQSTILESKACKDNIENKNVMFEITSETMDENLRTRCDEWVSRFVQIMEETLTQVLRKNSSLHLPPPLNMYEAAICVEKKLHNDEDVHDASKKFLNILNTICDEKGNINSNISPLQYMEMYSFGVYLIDALQGIFSTCEDLQTAAESLSKLLNDIQDPEIDMTNIEPLHGSIEEYLINDMDDNDNIEVFMIVETASVSDENVEDTEYVTNVPEVANENVPTSSNSEGLNKFGQFKITFNNDFLNNCKAKEGRDSKNSSFRAINIECNDKSQDTNDTNCTESQNSCNTVKTSPSRYNLRSKRVTMSPEKTDSERLPNTRKATQDDNLKSTFFSNLLLQKKVSKQNPYNRDDNFGENITNKDNTDNVDSFGYTENNVGCSYQFHSQPPDLSHETTVSNKPTVVRNFVICSEFEDRLRTRRIHDEMEEFDFGEEMAVADYLDEDLSSGGTGRLQIDEFPEYHDGIDAYHIDQDMKESSEYVKVDFKYFVTKIAEEIKELSSKVYTFSQNSCDILNSLSTSEDKTCIRARAEQAHLCVDKICMALTKILNRDKDGGFNVQEFLKHTEFDDISVDEDQLETYGAFISRCLEHVHDLKNTIEDVLSAVC